MNLNLYNNFIILLYIYAYITPLHNCITRCAKRQNIRGSPNGLWGGDCPETRRKPGLFWRYQAASSLELSLFARVVLTVIGNSVPSERAFSTMNYIHSKRRNRLDLDRADKLQFLHMNLLVLAKQKNHYEPTDEELLAWEDEFQAQQEAEYGQAGRG
jgi:hypothetical protein